MISPVNMPIGFKPKVPDSFKLKASGVGVYNKGSYALTKRKTAILRHRLEGMVLVPRTDRGIKIAEFESLDDYLGWIVNNSELKPGSAPHSTILFYRIRTYGLVGSFRISSIILQIVEANTPIPNQHLACVNYDKLPIRIVANDSTTEFNSVGQVEAWLRAERIGYSLVKFRNKLKKAAAGKKSVVIDRNTTLIIGVIK